MTEEQAERKSDGLAPDAPSDDEESRHSGSPLIRSAIVVVALTMAVFGYAAFSALSGPVPSMSLVPELPSDVAVARNESEFTAGAGGFGVRVLVLVSSTRSPAEVATDVARAFDADPSWRAYPVAEKADVRSWQHDPMPCSETSSIERTSAAVFVVDPGESVSIGQYDELIVDQPAVVVRLSLSLHVFCGAAKVIS